ncbi:MAG TPA: hypothetical protein VFY39_14435 [Gammaproteobacteria bacterium]|nr:hypothetical protein [Gammaproteobacteria bacterium]
MDPLHRARNHGPSPAQEALNAPLFASLVQQLDEEQRCVVLDLGAARTETVALFGRFRCRLDIADLAQNVDELNNEPEPGLLPQRAESVLPRRREEATDLVLCWDLLNYLQRPALRAVMSKVAERCRPGALVHALIIYSSSKMTREPGGFVPIDEQRLLKLNKRPEEREAPRYSPEDLARCLPGYTVERGRLLRNGMQEFLFRL